MTAPKTTITLAPQITEPGNLQLNTEPETGANGLLDEFRDMESKASEILKTPVLTFSPSPALRRTSTHVRRSVNAQDRENQHPSDTRVAQTRIEYDPTNETGGLVFIIGKNGRPMTKESFGNWFRKTCRAAGVEKSAHGLKKYSATLAAEGGATTHQLMAQFGTKVSPMS